MRKIYSISFVTIICFAGLIFGLIFSARYGSNVWRYHHPKNLTSDVAAPIRPGDYVVCDVKEYLVKPLDSNHQNTYTGETGEFIELTKVYHTYNMRLVDGRYILTLVYDPDTITMLNSYSAGKGEGVRFIGEVIRGASINNEWYNDPELEAVQIIPDVSIVQADRVRLRNRLMLGLIVLFLSLFGVISTFSVQYVRKERKDPVLDPERIYNFEAELDLNQKYLRRLKRKASEARLWAVLGTVITAGGLYMLAKVYWWEMRGLGMILVLVGLIWIGKWFMHSHLRPAVRMADIFGYDTVHKKIVRTEEVIRELEGQLRDEPGLSDYSRYY